MEKLTCVLLVDDNSTSNFLNELALTKWDVAEQLLIAENGAEALALLARAYAAPDAPYPALILLDVNMPIMNGAAFLEAYQQLLPAQQQASVVVLLTTSVHERELTHLRQLPVAGLVSKPLTRDKMDAVLQAHFQRQLLPQSYRPTASKQLSSRPAQALSRKMSCAAGNRTDKGYQKSLVSIGRNCGKNPWRIRSGVFTLCRGCRAPAAVFHFSFISLMQPTSSLPSERSRGISRASLNETRTRRAGCLGCARKDGLGGSIT